MYNSDDHNWKDNDKFRSVVIFSKATAIAMLSPVAVVGNAIILATIWRRTFPRTTFHILVSGIALNDLCTELIAQPCYATSFLISSTKDSKVKDNTNLAAILHTVGEATGKKLCFRRYIIHLPDLMAAFIKSYEKNVNESVKNPDCLGNC